MSIINMNSVVAVYESHDQAENAIRELQKDGFDMKKLSIVGKDYHTEEHVVGYYNTGDRMPYWGKLGAFWGGFWGLLFGSAFFWVPGVGPLLVAGPLVGWIVAAFEGAVVVGGIGALGAGLSSIGIPKNSIVQYETEVKNGRLLLVAHGTADEVEASQGNPGSNPKALKTTIHSEKATVASDPPVHDTDPKRKRGKFEIPSLTLRVSIPNEHLTKSRRAKWPAES